MAIKVPPQGVPIMDSQTGTMNPLWYNFFKQLTTDNPLQGATNGLISNLNATYTGRTITAGSAKLMVTDGAGATQDPTIDIGTGVYTVGGTTVAVTDGGTGIASTTAYAPILGGTTTTGNFQAATLGTAGTVLTSTGTSSVPTFQAPPAVAPITLVSTQTVSGVNKIDITGLTNSYNMYQIVLTATGSAQGYLNLRCSTNNGVSFDTGNNYSYSTIVFTTQSTGPVGVQAIAASSIIFAVNNTLLNIGSPLFCNLYMAFPSNGSFSPCFTGTAVGNDSSSRVINSIPAGYYTAATTVNAIRLYFSSGTITGTVKVYGIT